QGAVDQAAQRVSRVAGATLKKTAATNVEVSANRLAETLQEAKHEATNTLNASAEQMQHRGTKAVQNATQHVVETGKAALDDSLSNVRNLNQESRAALNHNHSTEMDQEWRKSSASPVKGKLQEALRRLWESSAERRAAAIQDFDGLVVNQVVARFL